jgi:hypothetical protein
MATEIGSYMIEVSLSDDSMSQFYTFTLKVTRETSFLLTIINSLLNTGPPVIYSSSLPIIQEILVGKTSEIIIPNVSDPDGDTFTV